MTNRLTALTNRPTVFTALALLAMLSLVAVGESQQTQPRSIGGFTVQLPPDAPTKPPLIGKPAPSVGKVTQGYREASFPYGESIWRPPPR